jgi:hypothetical protein
MAYLGLVLIWHTDQPFHWAENILKFHATRRQVKNKIKILEQLSNNM